MARTEAKRKKQAKGTSLGVNVALTRGLKIIEAFRYGRIFLGNNDLVRFTGIPKATVSRITHTLCQLGYLNFLPELNKFSVSPGILALAYPVYLSHEILVYARPLMQCFAEETQSTVGFGVRDGLSVVYLDYAKSRSAQTHDTAIGFRVPLGASAIGWACLAASRPDDRDEALAALRKAMRKEEWQALEGRIMAGMNEVWNQGFCLAYGNLNPQTNVVGVPFVHQDRSKLYALNCVGPRFLFTKERMTKDIGPRLLRLAEELKDGTAHFPTVETPPPALAITS